MKITARPRILLVAGVTVVLIVVAAAVSIGQPVSIDGLDGEGIKGVVVINGIPTPIDADQTPEEAEALANGPLWDMPAEFLTLGPGSEELDALAFNEASLLVKNTTPVDVTRAVVPPEAVREFTDSVGVWTPPLAAAAGEITVTAFRLSGANGAFVAPHARPGSSGELPGDTLVSIVSGPDRVNTIVVVGWDVVAGLFDRGRILTDGESMSLVPPG